MSYEELKKSLLEKFVGREVNEDTLAEITNEVQKAVKAGYETTPESHGNPVEDIEANAPTMDSNKVETKDPAKEPEKEAAPEAEAAPADTGTEDEAGEAKEAASEDEEKADESSDEDKEVKEPEAAKDEEQLKFEKDLFQNFQIGSTLKQRPQGNVMADMKEPTSDYEKDYKNSIKNVKVSEEEFKKEDK